MPERWDCLYADRITEEGRIVLKKPPEYGLMYNSAGDDQPKVRKSLPRECGDIRSNSEGDKIQKATAIATIFNRPKLNSSKGLVVRGFRGRTPLPGLQRVLIKTRGKALRRKGSTGWLVYVSPDERFYEIADRDLGDELTIEQASKTRSCIGVFNGG